MDIIYLQQIIVYSTLCLEPLDQDLNINGTIINTCIYVQNQGIINQNSCGIITGVQFLFNQSIVERSGIHQTLNIDNINPNNLIGAYVYIYYTFK